MEPRRSGLFHRSASQSLPTTASAASSEPNATMSARSGRRHHPPAGRNAAMHLAALAAIAILAVVALFVKLIPAKASLISSSVSKKKSSSSSSCPHGEERTWHGGHPAEDRPGSCWCGGDEYCMCTPSLAIDVVLYSKTTGKGTNGYSVWAVRRKDTGQLATIGGFVDVGETTERAVLREAEEETGIVIPPDLADSAMTLIGVYSDPRRDDRRSIVSVAYALEFVSGSTMGTVDGSGVPRAGDDAKEVVEVPLEEVGTRYKGEDWYADHLTILLDFKEKIMATTTTAAAVEREGELYEDVARSRCGGIKGEEF